MRLVSIYKAQCANRMRNPSWKVASRPADRTCWNGLPLGTGSSPTGLLDVVPRARQTPRLSCLHGPLVERSLSSGSRDTFPVARAQGGRANSALTPLPGNSAAHNASAVLNGLHRDRKRPRNCCRHKAPRFPRKAPRCATIPPSWDRFRPYRARTGRRHNWNDTAARIVVAGQAQHAFGTKVRLHVAEGLMRTRSSPNIGTNRANPQ